MFEAVIQAFCELPEIEAIALGGSRSTNHYDEKSDYDIYLYCTEPVSPQKRLDILSNHCSRLELGNHFWELEDNGTFLDGVDFDILYRNLDEFCQGIAYVVEDCKPQNAYTTCMWHNLLTCKILFDRNGRLTAAQRRFTVPYPELLRQNILNRGWKLLHSAMPAYELQIRKAAARNDMVSVNHRVSAFLETYFDILFALNRKTHPGEKRLIALCSQQCNILPDDFEENLNSLFRHMFTDADALSEDLRNILANLNRIM